MDKPSLKQYFGDSSSQFFDEIGTNPSDMIESVYLGDNETNPAAQGMSASVTQQKMPQEMTFSNVVPTVSTSAALPAASLPDPSTFFDTIGPQTGAPVIDCANPSYVTQAFEGLSIKNAPVDKEEERRRDAWIPSDEAKKTLMKAQSSPKGLFFPERDVQTMPGLLLEEELKDGLQEVVVKYLGVSAAGIRSVVRAEHVPRDEGGLRELLRAGYLRAAVNLSAALLAAAGQGAGRMGRPSRHTPRSLQLWLARFAVMVRLRMYDPLIKEAEAFGDLDKPDMYYQFYPDIYGNRPGTLVPFSLRLLLAEVPGHFGELEETLDKLYGILNVIRKMVRNLNDGKTEDGTGAVSEDDRRASLALWSGRETRVLHSVANCAMALKDYRLADEVLAGLTARAPSAARRRALCSARGRMWLLAGHVRAARAHLGDAQRARHELCPTADVREYVDLGLLDVANGKYQEAYDNFARAAEQEPTNVMVANNLSVCLLYMGRLKEAIAVLRRALEADPERGLNESLLINLCTLYELESSRTHEKKLDLLRTLCKYKSDTMPNVIECLKLTIS